MGKLGHKDCLNRLWLLPLLCMCILILSSCTSRVNRPDGPPDFAIDETSIADALPKPEPLSKYGNMRSYRVFGQRYYPLKSSKNFEEKGVASWYGTKFHQQRTSSGERYNMLAMTAAHKTLPLPTYVEVTNLKNGHRIIVKVNDRGPFADNRIIDLSYVAAKKLGIVGRGTAPVHIKAINPNQLSERIELAQKKRKAVYLQPAMPKAQTNTRLVYLQAGAFRSRANAEKLKSRLVTLLKAPVKISSPNVRTKLYRVQIGPLKDSTAMNKISSQLKKLGIATISSHVVPKFSTA